jgi:Lipase maturation factor
MLMAAIRARAFQFPFPGANCEAGEPRPLDRFAAVNLPNVRATGPAPEEAPIAGESPFAALLRRFFGPGLRGPGSLWPRWLFLRALGLTFFSVFYALLFQVRGLIGPDGILPAVAYLKAVAQQQPGPIRFYEVPTLFWLGSGNGALTLSAVLGIAAAVLLVFNLWPRAAVAVCEVCFLSLISALQDFSAYQSDGMLLAAGFVSLFVAPRGFRPGLGGGQPPSAASVFLLKWEWFRIYFESGIAKLASGDPQWRHLTSMDHYYENGPLPTWIGWYVQQLPHLFHAATALTILVVELAVVWLAWLPRRFRIACFLAVTPLQLSIMLTANYTFLNYLVMALGLFLLDDRLLAKFGLPAPAAPETPPVRPWKLAGSAAVLTLLFAATASTFLFPGSSADFAGRLLAPFRVANRYGLFAVMTRNRYEIEFQGSLDGKRWIPYPFRYKPQDPGEPPGLYAPYQPRFDWNLWFASLDDWRQNVWVVRTEALLLESKPDVLALFASNPFPFRPPRWVRTVIWQYAFTDIRTRRQTGAWWTREPLGLYAPMALREGDGSIKLVQTGD